MTTEQQLAEISVKVGRVEVMQEMNAKAIIEMAASVQRLVDKLEKSDDVAREALDKSKSAHHRLDNIDDNQKWIWRTVVGAILAGLIGLFWKGYGG
ncbi:hemolysin XhlA family protein [Paenibacillus sp. sgz302251]|uniref:hemolysin XhlA family protein n=1 Tax=Paenibacillus sp. sgz302251 TaxID=3414493 RepID=UPI003C7AC49D